MTSEERLFDALYARGDATAQTGGRAWLQAMLGVEAALARAGGAERLIPAGAAGPIAAVRGADEEGSA